MIANILFLGCKFENYLSRVIQIILPAPAMGIKPQSFPAAPTVSFQQTAALHPTTLTHH